MATAVRQANLPADRESLIEALREHLNPRTNDSRFRWLYEQNPHGKASIWIAVNQENGAIVGSTAALPRYFYLNGSRRLGCVFADSWTHPAFRYLGPAVSLQRACLQAVQRGEFAVAYDFPQKSMIAVYRRLRIPAADVLVTYERVLRLDRLLGNRVRPRALATTIAALGNPLLAMTERRPGHSRGMIIEDGPTNCGNEFDELAARTARSFGVHVARTSEYLNWRFVNHFHNRHEIIVARRADRLVGYLVMTDDELNSQVNVIDFLVEPELDIWSGLLASAVQRCRERRRSVLSVSVLSQDCRAATLRSGRFAARREVPFILLNAPEINRGDLQGSLGMAGFTYGDEAD